MDKLWQLLVPTKLAPPPAQDSWVERERLLGLLAPTPKTCLTVIVAAAGFGKSTLAAQMIQAGRLAKPYHKFAWLTLDEFDQDGPRFLAYVAGAIGRVAPEAIVSTSVLLTAPTLPPLAAMIEALLVDLAALPDGLTLVLDDYHTITEPSIHQAVSSLLRFWPPASRLVILSRTDPPLPLTRLRAEQQVTELRANSLRFTANESASLITNALGANSNPAVVCALHAETEGWPIALSLTVLVQRQRGDALSTHMARTQFSEYIVEEIVRQQPAELRYMLHILAVPERVCARLAIALFASGAGKGQIEEDFTKLIATGLLLPLDAEDEWYSFHRLLRDLLLHQLRISHRQEQIGRLQLQAARWFEAERLFEEAVRLYVAGGDANSGGALIERLLQPDLGRSISSLPAAYWLRLLPAELLMRRPGLALLTARVRHFVHDLLGMELALQQVDSLFSAAGTTEIVLPWRTFLGDCATYRAALAFWQGRPTQALDEVHTALHLGVNEAVAWHVLFLFGRIYAVLDRYEEGVRLLNDRPLGDVERLQGVNELLRLHALCQLHWHAGQIEALVSDARRLSAALKPLPFNANLLCFAESVLGVAAYERNDLDAAQLHFGLVRQHPYQVNAAVYTACIVGLALIALHRGDRAGAHAFQQQAQTFAAEIDTPLVLNEAAGCALELSLADGARPDTRRVMQQFLPSIALGTYTHVALHPPQLVAIRARMVSGDPAGLQEADEHLTTMLAEVEPLHNQRLVVALKAHQALVWHAQGHHARARTVLRTAVTQAERLGLVRTLADCGPTLKLLLQELAATGFAVQYLRRVLAAFDSARHTVLPQSAACASAAAPVLTTREAEVLALLAERWSNKEIAVRLVISPNTVRKHTSTLFSKLYVANRREAVAVARTLGLLPQS
jgi:LuxR family maltose regulon positive regulatory protein